MRPSRYRFYSGRVTDHVKGIPRRERAARTRRTIVAAATEEFRASGYHGATMSSIAKRAGVAVQTVYFVFNTKPALLTATIDNAVLGEDSAAPPQQAEWWHEGTMTSDARRAIELFVTNVADISTRVAILDRVTANAATTDPEIFEVNAHHQAFRKQGFREYVDTLVARGLLREGLDPAEATDVLLTLVGSDVFLNFTEERGWAVDRYVAWTTDALCTLLVDPPHSPH